jgi:hypothetical protein
MSHNRVVLLGPQRLQPTLNKAVAAARVSGPLAVITAGWEERESEDQEMRDHLGAHTVNLKIYERAEEVMASDRELGAAIRERQDRIRIQHELYRMRLVHAMAAARELLHREVADGYSEMLESEREGAIEAVRTLDAFHLMQVMSVHRDFEARMRPSERDSIVRHRRELANLIHGCGALCVAGGHVVALLHRMRLFDVLDLVDRIPIFAWSAGTMALSERVVLFHDSPPHGVGNAEVFDAGLGAFSGVVPLPHAKKRLHLHDSLRVSLFARRFAPAQVVALDPLTKMEWDGERWRGEKGTLRLTERGVLAQAGVA